MAEWDEDKSGVDRTSHCDHCDMALASCPHGNPAADREVLEAAGYRSSVMRQHYDLYVTGPTIEATQNTPCAGCSGRIEPGERITYTAEGWAHTTEVTISENGWEMPRVKPETDASIFEGIED